MDFPVCESLYLSCSQRPIIFVRHPHDTLNIDLNQSDQHWYRHWLNQGCKFTSTNYFYLLHPHYYY
jgi:hypothetical protein